MKTSKMKGKTVSAELNRKHESLKVQTVQFGALTGLGAGGRRLTRTDSLTAAVFHWGLI